MAFVANIGTPDSAQAPSAYAAPAVAGFYKVRIGEAKSTPVKNAPEVTMLRIPVRVIATVTGDKAYGFAEALIFNIPTEHASTYGEKYNMAAQQGRFRNLLEKAIAPEQSDALSKRTQVTIDPAQWKDIEAYARIDLKEDEYQGVKRMKGIVSFWLTEDEAKVKVGLKSATVADVLTPETVPLVVRTPAEQIAVDAADDGQLDLIPAKKVN